MRSMTGFGEARVERDGVRVHVVARSVNHRGLDVRVTTPSGLEAHESAWRDAIRARCHRGRVEVRVSAEATGRGDVDTAALDALVETYRAACERLGAGPPRLGDLLVTEAALSRMASSSTRLPADAAARVADDAVAEALDALAAFREREGAALRDTFVGHIDALGVAIDRIEALSASSIEAHRHRLRDAVAALVDGHSVDPERIESEVVIIAQRSDIAEEIQRAREHLRALQTTVEQSEDEARGRRLDFLLQELVRETNTMASKSVSAELTECVVGARTLVEQLREQSHNVE